MITVEHLSGFGEALKELRWVARMKQVEVCRATGMTAPQVSRYENGHEMPTIESLVKYLNAVGADLCDLQRVLTAGDETADEASAPAAAPPAAAEPARPAAMPATAPTGEPVVEPAVARRVSVDQVREDSRQRLETSSGLQQVVSGLLSLNFEGFDRLEQRMRSMEEELEKLRAAGGEK